jgi:gamma-glutamylaminecyclotransferase
VRPYPLFVDHYRVPYLVDRPGEGERITGELFLVDDAALAALDELEGVAAGRYTRCSIPVELLAGEANAGSAAVASGGDSEAWLYCIKDVPELEKRGALLAEYSAEVHASYTPKAGRDETLKRAWGGYEVL